MYVQVYAGNGHCLTISPSVVTALGHPKRVLLQHSCPERLLLITPNKGKGSRKVFYYASGASMNVPAHTKGIPIGRPLPVRTEPGVKGLVVELGPA